MRLKKTQKKNGEKLQDQGLYPKVKTFSRAYEYSHAGKETQADGSGYLPPFSPDERPYPAAPVPASTFATVPDVRNFNDPERIDLQDTLLTDESFTQRFPKSFPVSEMPVKDDKPAPDDDIPEEIEVLSEPDESESPETLFPEDNEGKGEPGSFFVPESETEDETEPFFSPEPDEEDEPASFLSLAVEDTDSTALFTPESDEEDEPFPWSEQDEENSWNPDDDSDIFAFKKKKYSARLGKKKNLKKKLISVPDGSLKWKSSNEKIAKVSHKGILMPKKKGKVTVRVKTKNGEKAKVKLRIKKAKKQRTLPWENLTAVKKGPDEKKWSYFA